jgi:hypothetical protein
MSRSHALVSASGSSDGLTNNGGSRHHGSRSAVIRSRLSRIAAITPKLKYDSHHQSRVWSEEKAPRTSARTRYRHPRPTACSSILCVHEGDGAEAEAPHVTIGMNSFGSLNGRLDGARRRLISGPQG